LGIWSGNGNGAHFSDRMQKYKKYQWFITPAINETGKRRLNLHGYIFLYIYPLEKLLYEVLQSCFYTAFFNWYKPNFRTRQHRSQQIRSIQGIQPLILSR
jgi:hypothetical protein